MIELKPCPFCGEKEKVYLRATLNETGFWVECVACGTSQRIRNREVAIEAWNTRLYHNKGKWKKTCVPDVFQCTNCKRPTKMDELCDSKTLRAYCPNCGAGMDVNEDDK